MAAEHQVRIVRTDDGYRAECAECEYRSLWQPTFAVAEFFAERHGKDPDQS